MKEKKGSVDGSSHVITEEKILRPEVCASFLKACAEEKDLHGGSKIHSCIMKNGWLRSCSFLGSSLVNMYVKCGALRKARTVLDDLPVQDVISCNALITGYSHQKNGEATLNFFQQMQLQGICPTTITFINVLKACSSTGSLLKGKRIHAQIVERQVQENGAIVGNALIDMYAKCAWLVKAEEVFYNLLGVDIVSWNALITGYAQYKTEKALTCFQRMQLGGFAPDAITFACILKSCATIGEEALNKGKRIHAHIVMHRSLEDDIVVGNSLVDMYAKCGSLSIAQEVFDKLLIRNVVTWNALISGYCQQGQYRKALQYFEHMQDGDISPNDVTFLCALKACNNIGALEKGECIHYQILREGLLGKNNALGSAVLDLYAKCGLLEKAQEVFEGLLYWDVVSWNTLIAGYAQHGYFDEVFIYVAQMQLWGISPDAVTFVCILKACGGKGEDIKGQEIHAGLVKEGLLERNVIVGNALVDMYAKCGWFQEAENTFENLPLRDTITFNVLIAGYIQHGHNEDALKCFQSMRHQGIHPDEITFVCMLKACGCLGLVDKGQEIHSEIDRRHIYANDCIVGTALVDMYSKCGELARARGIFENLPIRNIVSWSALIAGYVQHGSGEEALNCYKKMQLQGLVPDSITQMCIIKACSSIGAVAKGQEVHADIIRDEYLEKNNAIGNSLVDMYVKFGMFHEAQDVFDELQVQEVVSWNAILAGFAQLGEDEAVLNLSKKMTENGNEPNLVTFTIIVNVCSRAGLLENVHAYLEVMTAGYDIVPVLDHYICMIDLFSRAGNLVKAAAVIEEMPFCPNITAWNTVLGACQKWGDPVLGRLAFEHAVQFDEKEAAPYVTMINIYAAAGRQENGKH